MALHDSLVKSIFRLIRSLICGISVLFLICLFLDCGGGNRFVVPEPVPEDRKPVPQPKERNINIAGDVFEKQFFDQLKQSFNLSRQYRNVTGTKKQVYNVNAFDEVENSSWFTNRNHLLPMTLEEIGRGPNTGQPGPDTSTTWTIIRVKSEGVTPGFTIRDGHGVGYVIKFEPIGYSEMVSGAEVVSTKLFHAAGYNVPENYIIYFNPKILSLGEKVKITDAQGRTSFMTKADLQKLMKKVEVLPSGLIRVAASKLLEGKSYPGPFSYKGMRKDDPNDIIPHQHRRELRGLRVIAAWLNHFDTKDNNTLDVYTNEGYVRHYLIDFGSTLGSNGDEPMPPIVGYENSFDPHEITLNTVTAGLYVRPYFRSYEVKYNSIGYFDSELFHPQKYKFILPNPAFELMTSRDGFWGAKIVMSFTDEQIWTAIKEGQYSNPEAERYLLKVLKERRDKVGRYWFKKMNPLDRFELIEDSKKGQILQFVDFAIETGLEKGEKTTYRYQFLKDGKKTSPFIEILKATAIVLDGSKMGVNSSSSSSDKLKESQWAVSIQTKREATSNWSNRVTVYLRHNEQSNKFQIMGLNREE
jgi:hypothetical protein